MLSGLPPFLKAIGAGIEQRDVKQVVYEWWVLEAAGVGPKFSPDTKMFPPCRF